MAILPDPTDPSPLPKIYGVIHSIESKSKKCVVETSDRKQVILRLISNETVNTGEVVYGRLLEKGALILTKLSSHKHIAAIRL